MSIFYTPDHQWIDDSDTEAATVGITAFAQEALGDVVFVELPAIGMRFAQGEVVCVVESVKAAADVHLPVGGEVVAVNDALRDDPGVVNTDPLGAGWFVKIRVSNVADLAPLLDQAAYEALIATG